MSYGYRGAGYAGLIGTMLILFAFLSAVWGINDPTLNFDWWVVSMLIFGTSIGLAGLLGFRLNKSGVTIADDIKAAIFGVVSGATVVGINLIVAFIDPAFSYTSSQGAWLTMLAPVSETFIFDVVIYEIFDWYFQGTDWLNVAVASDLTFVGYHYFKYFAEGNVAIIEPILIIIILTAGNTLFVFGYHMFKNATAPMVAHTIVNFASQRQQVIQIFIDAVPTLMSLLVIVVIVVFAIRSFRRRSS